MSLKFNPVTGNFDVVLDKASEIKYDGTASGLVATTVQSAVDEVQSNIDAIPTPITYIGTWDASTNTPALANTDTGKEGFLYQVNVAGTVNFGAGNISFDIGDKVVNNGSIWQKWDMTDAVTSVNGQAGAVVLTTTDINEGTNLYFTDERAQDAVGGILQTGSKVSLSYNDALNTISSDIVPASLVDADISLTAAIAATKLGNGDVDNTELSYLNGVTSSIQTQLNGKQATGNYITDLTGDVTATGPGSVAKTLATVNSNVGSFGTASNVSTVTVNAKGLVTAASDTPIQIAESQVTNLTTDLSNKADKNLSNILPTTSVDFNAQKLSNVADPTLDQDVVTNKYAKSILNGPKNYLGIVNNVNGNGNFELGSTSKWSLAHTTLSSLVPNQASGSWTAASGNLSISAVTSGKLAGSYSLSMASSAASTAGDMLVSDAFTIDLEDQAKVLTFKAYYSATSGSSNINWSGTSANTLQIYIYDVTNSAWIQPAGVYGMTQSSGVGYVTGTFQSTSNSTQYRLAVVNVNASAGAFTILMDDFSVGPQTAPIGAVVTDWQGYTPTFTNISAGTGGSGSYAYRRVGDSMEIVGRIHAGGSSIDITGDIHISLPSGYSIDFAKISSFEQSIGSAHLLAAGNYRMNLSAIISTSATAFYLIAPTTTTPTGNFLGTTIPQADASYWIADSVISWSVRVPIVGLSSNVQMSNDTDTRIVAFVGGFITTSIPVGAIDTPKIIAPTTINDTHGAYNSSSGAYTVPVTGYYRVTHTNRLSAQSAGVAFRVGFTINSTSAWYKSVDGSDDTAITANPTCVHTVYLNAGDIIRFAVAHDDGSARNLISDGRFQGYNIERLSGPATIAASETVALKYTTAAGQSIAGTGSFTTIVYGTKVYDTHGSFNSSTGVFTAPISGLYRISATATFTSHTPAAASNQYEFIFRKNGSGNAGYLGIRNAMTTTTQYVNFNGSDEIYLLAGETLDVQIAQNTGSSQTLFANATGNSIKIRRVGN